MARADLYALWGTVALIGIQALVLFSFGQPPICQCGYVALWEGVVKSSGNSQHLTDWYTFSHVVHGFIFYGLLRYFFPRLSFAARLMIATGIEAAWEIAENTPLVINYYRQQALAQGYTGDSILNSASDTIAMVAGFLLASRARVWFILALAVAMEVFVGYFIRDNLTLNVLNFIYIFPAIEHWQTLAP